MMAMARSRLGAVPTVAAATVALGAVAWVLTVRQMNGMAMGVSTPLGSFTAFLAVWVGMIAAMMLPGAVPAVIRRARAGDETLAVVRFIGAYIAVWAVVGVAVYALYRPHGTTVAGAVVIAAGLYELTPLKRHSRRRCQEAVRSGTEFGLCCVGSCLGLMLIMVAVSIMSIGWMTAITAVVLSQKLLPARVGIDLPLALATVALGVLIVVSPASVPGLMPTM
jgi:predicted metal-binding membrane protein